jgi:transglutaminase-like putative cysteine protease/tetratricopeptide (TPR) repeat protein
MERSAFLQALVLGIAMVAPSLCQGAAERGPFSASPQALLEQAKEVNPQGKHVATVILQDSRYRFDNEGRVRATHWMIYCILSKDAGVWAEVNESWSSWRENRPTIRARVITPDGSVHLLDPKTVEDAPTAAPHPQMYSDQRRLRGPLPSIVEGAVVETVVEVQETNSMFGAGFVRRVYLRDDVPSLKMRLVLEFPKDLPLRYVVQLAPELQPLRSESGSLVRLEFETGPSDAAESILPNLPSDIPRWPSITFATGESWSTVAKRFGTAVDEQIATQEVRDLLPQVATGATREQLARSLLDYVNNKVRYTGVEFGEAAWLPRKPSETLKHGFGDCKDKAAVLIALLRAAGMDARLALLRTGPGPDIEPEAPGLGAFDHAVVYVPGEPALWIDATDPGARPGQLPLADQGRYALIVGEGKSTLLRTPVSGPMDNRTVETREFFLPAIGKARIVETAEFWGGLDLIMRDDYAGAGEEQVRKLFQNYGESAYLSKKLSKFDRGDVKDYSRPFTTKAEYLDAGRGVVEKSEALVVVRREDLFSHLPGWMRDPRPDESKPRTEDVELLPFTAEWRYNIHMPTGFQPRELPPPENRKLGRATYSHTFQIGEKGSVTGVLHFDTGTRRMTASEAESLRAGVVEILKAQPLLLYFDQTGEKLLAEGQIREALEEFRNVSTAEPKEAVHRTRIARALLAAGLGEAARKEAREAVALNASSATAHQTLAWTLQHDLVGRRFEKGFDLQASIASYLKAKALDPDDVTIRGDLAILLEHNAAGERYGRGADLAHAIEEYRALLKLPDSGGLLDNLLIACLRAGRFEVLKEYLAVEMPPDLARWPLDLAVRAVVNGASEAAQQAARSITDSEKRTLALSQAGLILMQNRFYTKAADIFTAAARGGKNTAQLLAQANQMAKVKRWEEIPILPDTPQSVVKQMVLAMLGADDPETALKLLAHWHKEDRHHQEDLTELKRGRRLVDSMAVKIGLSREVLADIALAVMQETIDGDDQVGYLVKTKLPNQSMTFIVVKEGGAYRLLDVLGGSNSSAEFTGYEVLARAEQGWLPEARQLLDWIRDEISPTGGDDPLAGPVFPRFWQKGETGSTEAIRQAGAALLAGDKSTAADSIPLLKAGLQNASDAASRERLQLALAVAYRYTKQLKELLDTAASLYANRPNSDRAFSMISSALADLGRWSELEAHVANRLKKDPHDPVAIRARLQAALDHGDLEVGRRQEDLLRQSGKLQVVDLNNLAWLALIADKVDQRALETLQEGILQSQANPDAELLHTAAVLYAEIGKPVEAREVLLQSIDVKGIDEPDSASWYVFGRIAENYGQTAAAHEMYKRVTKPENLVRMRSSIYALAQKHLNESKDPSQRNSSTEP